MAIVLIWLVFGLLGAVVGQGLSGETGGGFLMGLLLGPIGVLIAAQKKPDRNLVDRSRQQEDLTECYFCGRYNEVEAVVCRRCGRDVLPIAAQMGPL